jgi:ABC-type Zn uptake system ZnuABC Zn-binding protein ZnuA
MVLESITQEIEGNRRNIAATLEKEILRPVYAATYQKNIARYEARIQQLEELQAIVNAL